MLKRHFSVKSIGIKKQKELFFFCFFYFPALFASQEEFDEFNRRHSEHTVPRADLSAYRGPCYLGLDAGSTTIKAVLLSEDDKILYSHYQNNEGSPLKAAQKIVAEIYRLLPDGAFIAKSGITGYGEFLLKEAHPWQNPLHWPLTTADLN